MRRKIRAPLTDLAKHLAIKKLAELRDQGEDLAAVLNKATLNSWREPHPIGAQEKSGPRAIPPLAKPERKLEWEAPPNLDSAAGRNIWDAALKELSQQIDRHSFETWFQPTQGAGLGDGVLFVLVPNATYSRMLEDQKYSAPVAKVIPGNVRVRYVPAHQEVAVA